MQKPTRPTRISAVKRSWHLFDVKDQVLGRISTTIAVTLMGKAKPYYVRNLDCGDYVVVINAQLVKVTGRKESEKLYSHFSGYPGGLKQKPLKQIRSERPELIIRQAVYGMLPKNKLRDRLISRLFIFAGNDHPYQDKINQ
ncbi:50S ribosomal protein L13 [Candidatus Gottesmanbacteria bacterium RBG_16_43_7]|uniref:Large ribosomal subunit protein uL13 n=1 Tax=Candidatus Gottesmanbacteria bacterium RBG_16_43_7 TaxID=1798373 RepID=A0A1F5ZA39_9BACT|nr:MAG: 50S ribosomal protein L13 [Candidatus Gottesmanbacteria bacterium RBG_16_43_7]